MAGAPDSLTAQKKTAPYPPDRYESHRIVKQVFASAVILIAISHAALASYAFSCSSPYVVDGDTFQCGQERVRLAGIDAPELAGHCKAGRRCTEGDAQAAREALIELTRTEITCTAIEIDKYGRTIAMCHADAVNLSCAMIASGHAVARYRQINCGE